MEFSYQEAFGQILHSTGFVALAPGDGVMLLIACTLLYLAIYKKFEPLLLLPMGFVGLPIAQALPPTATKVMIGLFVLVATWSPGALLLGTHPEASNPNRRFFMLGGVVGALNVTIGATGPLIAPFFLNLGLDRFQLVGTKAACQTLGHLAKLVVFGIAGFAFGAFVPLLLLLAGLVVVGTWIGSRLLEHVDERFFTLLYKSVLTAIAAYLIARQIVP